MILQFKRLAQNLALLALIAFSGLSHAAITRVGTPFGFNSNTGSSIVLTPTLTYFA